MQLGRLGVWYGMDRLNGKQVAELVAKVERLGYDALWYPEGRGYESFSLAGFLLGHSTRLKIGSSIASIYARDAFTSRRGLITLRDLHGDRFILGLGVSHIPMVEGMRGHVYEKPVPAMRAYLDGMTKGETDTEQWPIALAALGPRMLALAATKTRGALPYNVTPEHTAQAKAILGSSKWLAVEQKVCVETDAARARGLGRHELARYMTLPNYRDNWLRLGFTEAELADGGNDRFIDAMVLWGDAATVKRKLRAHFDAGATHVCIQPVPRRRRLRCARPYARSAGRHLKIRRLTMQRGSNYENDTLVLGMSDLARLRRERPMVLTGGRGVFVIDEHGRDYIEAVSSFYCVALGYSDAELVEAATRQLRSLPMYPSAAHRTVPVVLELAEKLAAVAPIPNARVAFATTTGSEQANDNLDKIRSHVLTLATATPASWNAAKSSPDAAATTAAPRCSPAWAAARRYSAATASAQTISSMSANPIGPRRRGQASRKPNTPRASPKNCAPRSRLPDPPPSVR